MKMQRYSVFGILLLCSMLLGPVSSFAQIGVGTTSPHPSSMLHLSPGAGNNKGVILPKVTSGSLIVLDSTQNLAHGLIFFDTDLQKFYYFHSSPRKWFELDHDWIRKDIPGASPVVGANMYSGVPGNVGIGTAATVNPAAKLTVVGNVSIGDSAFTQDSVPPANSLIVKTWIGIATKTRTAGYELDVLGQARISSTLRVDGTVTAAQFTGEGVVPTGGIVMYSGLLTGNFDGNGVGQGQFTGWQLCNGKNSSPDLRGRFIVGMTNSDGSNHGYSNDQKNLSDYNSIGDFGGEYEHQLTLAEMPTHDHPNSTTTNDGNHNHDVQRPNGCYSFVGAGDTGCYFATPNGSHSTTTDGAHSHDVNVTPEGGDQAHENRPPYYVLAFMIKQ